MNSYFKSIQDLTQDKFWINNVTGKKAKLAIEAGTTRCTQNPSYVPDVTLDGQLIDSMTVHLVRNPERFDVVVATNFYGDILSDLASELAGSIGLAGSIMASETHCCAQAQHGSAPDIAGKDLANPTSMILSVSMLLDWMAEKNNYPLLSLAAKEIEAAVDQVLMNPNSRTLDLGGQIGCKEFGMRIAAMLK